MYNFIKNVLFISLSIITLSCSGQSNQNDWDKKLESEIRTGFKNILKSFNLPEKQIEILSDCALKKLKYKFPNIKSLTQKEIYEASKDAFKECDSSDYKFLVTWNKELEDNIILLYTKDYNNQLKGFSTSEKEDFAKCIIKKLKSKYPNGFNKINEQENEQLQKDCYQEILKKTK
jgi:hypothetical protein